MTCKLCGRELPEKCHANRKYCWECKRRKETALRRKYYAERKLLKDTMVCKLCGCELPKGCNGNQKYCEACSRLRNGASKRRHRAKHRMRRSEWKTAGRIETPDDGYIMLAAAILKSFSEEYDHVLQRYKDDPCQEHADYLEAFESQIRRNFDYLFVLSMGALDGADQLIYNHRAKIGLADVGKSDNQ